MQAHQGRALVHPATRRLPILRLPELPAPLVVLPVSRYERRGGLGFGGAVGLGVALALLIAVVTIGHAIFSQAAGAASTVLIFAEIAACVTLSAVVLAVLGLLAYRGQLARYHLAERRLGLEQQARQVYAVRAQVISDTTQGVTSANASLPTSEAPKLEMPSDQAIPPVFATARRLWSVPRRPGGDAS
jgi:hypothetical protein